MGGGACKILSSGSEVMGLPSFLLMYLAKVQGYSYIVNSEIRAARWQLNTFSIRFQYPVICAIVMDLLGVTTWAIPTILPQL